MADLADDCEKYAKTYVEAGVTEACKQMVDATEKALEEFYGSYKPRVYDRDNNIRDNSWTPIMEISGESGRGGVRLSSSGMHEYWHHGKNVTTEDIYLAVMNWGMHGLQSTSTPPMFMIVSAIKQLDIEKFAENVAGKQSYKVLKF